MNLNKRTLAIAVAVLVGSGVAHASDDYSPSGIKLAGFTLKPDLQLRVLHDTNIYGVHEGTVDDLVVHLIPKIAIRSDWKKHSLDFRAEGDFAQYQDNGAEDYEDIKLRANGRIDLSKTAKITGKLDYSWLHSDRSDPDTVQGINPEEYTLGVAGVGFEYKPSAIGMKLDFERVERDYDDVLTNDPLNPLRDADYKDRTDDSVTAELSYDLDKESTVFGRILANTRDYDNADNSMLVERDSDGYMAVIGTRYNGRRLRGEAYTGWMVQEYDFAGVDEVSDLAFKGTIVYDASKQTKLNASITRDRISETTGRFAAAIATNLNFAVEHHYQKNFSVKGGVTFMDIDYQNPFGNESSKNEDLFKLDLTTTYDFSKNVYAQGGYIFEEKYGRTAADDYINHKLFLGVGVRM